MLPLPALLSIAVRFLLHSGARFRQQMLTDSETYLTLMVIKVPSLGLLQRITAVAPLAARVSL